MIALQMRCIIRPLFTGLRICAVVAMIVSAPWGTSLAQTPPAAAARQAAEDLLNAIQALDDANGANNRVTALTRVIRAHEDGLASLRDSLRQVDLQGKALEQRLDLDRSRITRLLGVMAGMERSAGPLLMLHPAGPLGTARAGSLLTSVAPALQAEADALAAQLAEITTLRAVQQGAADTLAKGLRSVQSARVTLSRAISERTDLPRRLTETPEALAALVQSSDTLEAFAGLLMDTRLAPEPAAQSFSQARGALPLPVQGRVVRGFDSPDPQGVRHPGLVIATRPKALVTLPWPATVRYAGPLLDYGNVMIAEPQDGYLLILTGMGELFAEVGQVLPAGAPIGLMGGNEPETMNFSENTPQAGSAALTESLYIELREANTPIDPAPWFEHTGNRTPQ
jgi:septal ring factor EnvC (AmiA/AmiB activator)